MMRSLTFRPPELTVNKTPDNMPKPIPENIRLPFFTVNKGLVRNSLITGAVGYVIFFIISLILAEWVTKPVEKTWNEQKQFIADASHELKTPLTVIITNAEMMSDRNYTEEDKENFTRNILSTSKRMRGLVESLLELARLDKGNKK